MLPWVPVIFAVLVLGYILLITWSDSKEEK